MNQIATSGTVPNQSLMRVVSRIEVGLALMQFEIMEAQMRRGLTLNQMLLPERISLQKRDLMRSIATSDNWQDMNVPEDRLNTGWMHALVMRQSTGLRKLVDEQSSSRELYLQDGNVRSSVHGFSLL